MQRALLDQIKTTLTSCVRGERFCDGQRGAMIQEGRIGEILRWHHQLRAPSDRCAAISASGCSAGA
jgi:hypothetical protein